MAEKYTKLPNTPPPKFLGEKERNFSKQITDEVMEQVIGQEVTYFPLDRQLTNYHDLYGEAIVKNFLPPIQIYALVTWKNMEITATESYGADMMRGIDVHFHKRRLTEDKKMVVQIGDFVHFGDGYYEIVKLYEPKLIWGQIEHEKVEISATCIRSREGLFNGK